MCWPPVFLPLRNITSTPWSIYWLCNLFCCHLIFRVLYSFDILILSLMTKSILHPILCALAVPTVFFLVRDLYVPCISKSYFLMLFPVLSKFFSEWPCLCLCLEVFFLFFPPVVSESRVLHEGLWSILNRFFCSMRELDATSFSYIEISGFLTRVCCRALVLLLFWHFWWKFSDFDYMGLLVYPLLCSFGLHIRSFAEPFCFCCCGSVGCDFRWGFGALSIVLPD